jgi:hypothetical protein
VPYADGALNALMQEADIFKVGRRRYLVAPLTPELVDTLIMAAGATEDDEEDDPGGETGHEGFGRTVDDEEDDPGGGNVEDEGEAALGWANEGSQEHLGVPQADEAEPSLGWADTGTQLRLAAGYDIGTTYESDGLEDGEGSTGGELNPADIDAQRGRIASRWPCPDIRTSLPDTEREKATARKMVERFVQASIGGKGGAA